MNTYIDTEIIRANIQDISARITAINDIFNNVNNDMQRTQTYEYWCGNTSDVVFKKYDELKTSYDTVISSLMTLTNFVNIVCDAYESFEMNINNSVTKGDLDIK